MGLRGSASGSEPSRDGAPGVHPVNSDQQPPRGKGAALALLATTQFVVILDASIVNVALPSIGSALEFSQQNLSWVVNAYTLTFGGFLLLGGRLADLLGRRRMFMIGLVLFSFASLLGGLAQSDLWLIAARALQGLGAALISPAALSLVTTIFAEGAERNRALGIWGAVAGSGGAAGVLLGGMLTEWAGWEWVLFVNVPIGVAAAALAPRLLPENRDEGAARDFDATGAVLVTGGLALLVYTLVDAESAGWTSTQTLGLGALSLATLAAFVGWESRASHPLMPFGIFRLKTLRGANAVGLLLGMSLFSMFFFISLYMQQVLGYSPIEAGFAFLPLAVTIMVSATVAARLVTRFGARGRSSSACCSSPARWCGSLGRGRRLVSGRSAVPLARRRRRSRPRLRPRHHRRRGRDAPRRGGTRVRVHQHQPAGRRRARLAILASIATSRTASVVSEGVGDQAAALTEGFHRRSRRRGVRARGRVLAAVTISSRDCRERIESGRVDVPAPCAEQPQAKVRVAVR